MGIGATNNTILPATRSQLEDWMIAQCYNFNSYSVNGSIIHEGYGIDKADDGFVWYYTERGQKSHLKYFQTEKEIVQYAFEALKNDKWARTHCIGFTGDKKEALELAEKLKLLRITFIQDEIPFYGWDKPAFRTFVLGCDHKLVNDLKEQYNKAPW
ncbi:MAG TPA: hypothetical protein VM935_01490 [Chitinophagaceae bacterium]|nr:hypothetical protein [Chitinophagaceae bacterium]